MFQKIRQTKFWVVLFTGVLFVCATALRIAGAWWYAYSPNPDYAVVVQMARHMASGRGFPAFFYGQAYMGSFEPAVSAAFVWLLGPSPFVVCLGTAAVSLLVVVAVFLTVRRIAGVAGAFAATVFCLIGPVGHFHYMCSPRGGYALCLLLTVVLFYAATFLDDRPGDGRWKTIRGFFGLGLACGLGFWNFWLVMPTIGMTGLMLFFRLRWRLFRPRIFLPGLVGFAFGSFPWWVWNMRHGWASLASSASAVDLHAYTKAARIMFTDRIPSLIGFFVVNSPVVQWVVYILVVLLILLPFFCIVAGRRDASMVLYRRLAAAVVINLLLFTVAFVTSSFATTPSPRYMLPLVPVFAIWAGCGVGACHARLKRAGRAGAVWGWKLAHAGAWGAVAFLGVLSFSTLPVHRAHPRAWPAAARALAVHRTAQDALYADFILYGINWATDEAVCAVSPRLWRYLPYAERLERAQSPGVLENMGAFSDFLKHTSTTASFARPGGYRLHYDVVSPATDFAVLPADDVFSIVDEKGVDWRRELVDHNGQTAAFLHAWGATRDVELHVVFREPIRLSGVRAITRLQAPISAWAIDGQRTAEGEWTELSGMFRDTGFFWSGSRFYTGGLHHRVEKFFPEETVHALRIRMPVHWSSSSVSIETLQFLTTGLPRANKDPVAVSAWLAEHRVINRVFADRWLANQLVPHVPAGTWVQREPVLTGEDVCWAASVPFDGSAAVVVNGSDAEQTRRVFREAGVAYTETETGGFVTFIPKYSGDDAERPDLRFAAGQLFNNVLPTASRAFQELDVAYFGGELVLTGISEWMMREAGTRTFIVALDWRIVPGFTWPKNMFVFLHGLNDKGKIAFQLDEPLLLDPSPYGSQEGRMTTTVHPIPVPPDVTSGTYRVLLGLLKPGLLPKRVKPQTVLPVSERRIVLPLSVDVVDE